MNNKIKIPWYRRNVKGITVNDMGQNPISFHIPSPRLPEPKGKSEPQPQEEPVRDPVRDPVKSPVTSPNPELDPFLFPFPFPDVFPKPFPTPFPTPFPLPDKKPNNKNPAPMKPSVPVLPLIPDWVNNPDYDWNKHLNDLSKLLPTTAPKVEKKNPVQEAIETILKPALTLLVLNEVKNQYIKVNVTDPIYNQMLQDPVLGSALREAEKANLDAGSVGTYFANYDWDNFNAEQMTKDLTLLVGAAGAARIIIFIIGRKVLFRM